LPTAQSQSPDNGEKSPGGWRRYCWRSAISVVILAIVALGAWWVIQVIDCEFHIVYHGFAPSDWAIFAAVRVALADVPSWLQDTAPASGDSAFDYQPLVAARWNVKSTPELLSRGTQADSADIEIATCTASVMPGTRRGASSKGASHQVAVLIPVTNSRPQQNTLPPLSQHNGCSHPAQSVEHGTALARDRVLRRKTADSGSAR
jgi:hypothetical protein